MYTRYRAVTCIALFGGTVVATAAIRPHGTVVRPKPSLEAARNVVIRPPTELGFNPEFEMGKSIKVKQFIRNHTASFPAAAQAAPFWLKATGNTYCRLRISVATGSLQIKKISDSKNGFIVALITNPEACPTALAFNLAATDTAAWYMRYDKTTAIGAGDETEDGIGGKAGLILLKHDDAALDDWFPIGQTWTLGYCNHNKPHASDQALVLAFPERCTATTAYDHNAKSLYADMSIALNRSKGTLSNRKISTTRLINMIPDQTNLTLWFACGGDCCYANFAQ